LGPLTVRRRVAGRAVTVKLGPPLKGTPKQHLGVGAILAAHEGDIIVVEHRGRLDTAGWGGLLSRSAVKKGVAAVVIDGACRDVDECIELGLPIYARQPVPVTARGRAVEHSFNEAIVICDVVVKPSDLVLADGNGVVFIDAVAADDVILAAEEIFAREQFMAGAIDRGRSVGEVMDAEYEKMLIKTG